MGNSAGSNGFCVDRQGPRLRVSRRPAGLRGLHAARRQGGQLAARPLRRRRHTAVGPRVHSRRQPQKQARAMFIGGLLWVLESKRTVGLDPHTGQEKRTCPAGNTHCFPPVGSAHYVFGGEMHLSDLETARWTPIRSPRRHAAATRAWCRPTACSTRSPNTASAGRCSATTPPWRRPRYPAALRVPPTERCASVPGAGYFASRAGRSGSRLALLPPRRPAQRLHQRTAPREPAVLWTAALGDRPAGVIADDWRCNYFIRGPIGPPVAAGRLVYVTRPDAHQVVALDAGKRPRAVDLHRQRPRRHRADDPPRAVPVRLQERLGLLSAGRRRRGGVAAAGGPVRRADRGLRPARVALAGAGQRAGGRRRGLFRRRAAAAGRRRHPRLCRRSAHRPRALDTDARPRAAEGFLRIRAAWSSTTSISSSSRATRWPCRAGCSTARPAG